MTDNTAVPSFYLMTINQLAEYVGRHPQLIREYFAEGVLPEPMHCVVGKHRTTRRFTMSEAERIKHIFATATWGTFAKKRERKRKGKLFANRP